MDKVTIQFEKLQSQGKINLAEKVKMSNIDTFEAESSLKDHKTIKYNEGMINLQDDEINFWLLHEEGHFVDPMKKIHRLYFFVIIFISLIPLMLAFISHILLSGNIYTTLLLIVSFFLFPLILNLFACRWMRNIQQKREYEADDFACKKIDNPLKIESVFEQARYHSTNKKNCLQKIFACIICSKLAHPSDEDRINRIKKNHSEIILLESEKERMDEKIV